MDLPSQQVLSLFSAPQEAQSLWQRWFDAMSKGGSVVEGGVVGLISE